MDRRRRRGDRGAALVEFALVVPVLAVLTFGMISAGQMYNRNLEVQHTAQQAVRYASTLPLAAHPTTDDWLDDVFEHLLLAADGVLDESTPDREVCIAYVDVDGANTASRTWTIADAVPVEAASPCFADGLPDDQIRVQVTVERGDVIDAALIPPIEVTLRRDVTSLHQAGDA